MCTTIFRNGSSVTDIGGYSTSTSITVGTECSTSGFTNSCRLSEGNETTVSSSYQISGRNAAGTAVTEGLYSIGIAKINWLSAGNTTAANGSTYMSGENDWRTADVSFP